jgi:hypothetical protein
MTAMHGEGKLQIIEAPIYGPCERSSFEAIASMNISDEVQIDQNNFGSYSDFDLAALIIKEAWTGK